MKLLRGCRYSTCHSSSGTTPIIGLMLSLQSQKSLLSVYYVEYQSFLAVVVAASGYFAPDQIIYGWGTNGLTVFSLFHDIIHHPRCSKAVLSHTQQSNNRQTLLYQEINSTNT